jgi:hypothetical protein
MGETHKLGQDQRLTFRVAVRGNVEFDAWLLLGGKKLAAAVGDISAEGLFMLLARGPVAALKVEGKVDVIIEFEGETMVMHGVICSQRDGGYGIHFPERDASGRKNPLTRFGRISAALQRTSLSQRLRVLKLPE